MSLGFPLCPFSVSGEGTVLIAAGSSARAEALQLRLLPPELVSRTVFVPWIAVGPRVVASAARSDVGDAAISGGTSATPVNPIERVPSALLLSTVSCPWHGLGGTQGPGGRNRTVSVVTARSPRVRGSAGGSTST